MKTWNLSSSKDGFSVTTYEIPWWVTVAESTYMNLCYFTRGWLGGHGMPDIFWKIPLGLPKRDSDGDLENSIPGRLYDLENAIANWSGRKETNHLSFPVAEEVAALLAPDFVKEMKDLYSDD